MLYASFIIKNIFLIYFSFKSATIQPVVEK